jgi:MFS family permease
MKSLARSRIRRLATGRLISVTGGAAAFTALNFTVWDRTHSPTMQALSLLLTFGVAGILGPFAGVLGDRYDRRWVMIWSEAVGAALFFAMMFVAQVEATAALIALAFAASIAEQPFFSSSRAAIPNLIDSPEDLNWANSLVTIGVHSGIAIGPVLGGLLWQAFGPGVVFGLNAMTFVVSLALTLSVRGDYQRERTAEDEQEHGGVGAGLRFLWRDWALRRLSVAWFVFVIGLSVGMVADAPLAASFGKGAAGYGLMITAWGLGSTLGAASGRWIPLGREGAWMVRGAAGIVVFAAGVGWAPVFELVLVSLFLWGVCDGVTIVTENSIMQQRAPDVVRSRANAAFEAVLSFGLAAGYLMAGPILSVVSPQGGYRIAAAGGLVAALWLLPLRRLRPPDGGGADGDGGEREPGLAVQPAEPRLEPSVPGAIAMRFTSAEELEAEREPGSDLRTA